MSFSSVLKNEIHQNVPQPDDCCAAAELAALFAVCGSVYLRRGGMGVRFANENAGVARRIFSLGKQVLGVRMAISAAKGQKLSRANQYRLDMEEADAARRLLVLCGVLKEGGDGASFLPGAPWELLKKECCQRAYLRGAFLGGGTMSDPVKGYHVDIHCPSAILADDIAKILANFGLSAKIASRKNSFVVYLKESDAIIDFLTLCGAVRSVFTTENTRILKSISNDVNRAMNCEAANAEKTLTASALQCAHIQFIMEKDRFRTLPKPLRESAELRLEYPEATLIELGDHHSPPVSKSCINHRMAKLKSIAIDLGFGQAPDEFGL